MTAVAGATTSAYDDDNNVDINNNHDLIAHPAAAAATAAQAAPEQQQQQRAAAAAAMAGALAEWGAEEDSEASEGMASLSLSTSSSATQLLHHADAAIGAIGGIGGATGGAASSTSSEPSEESSSASEGEDEEGRAYVAGCFEGPEKTLEVCFKPGVGHPRGCRELTRAQLDVLCKQARCTILNQISNQYQDAYVLSESSLFVWPFKMMLKTCGTTTLLRCLPRLLEFTAALGMELEWVGYSRKNFSFPGDQFFPHSSFDQELAYLKSHSKLSAKLNGSGYVLGPLTGDHFYLYVADKCVRPSYECHDRVLNIMMFDMDPEAAKVFYKEHGGSAREMTVKSGIAALVPGATIDDFAFDPCGYSMNAITYGNYATVHVTPEPECSYASFETNTPLKSYDPLINNVLRVFRPKRFVLTMMADEGALVEMESHGLQQRLPFERAQVLVPGLGQYSRASSSSTTFEKDYRCFMGTWTLDEGAPPKRGSTATAAAAAAVADAPVFGGVGKKGKKHGPAARAAAAIRCRGVSFG